MMPIRRKEPPLGDKPDYSHLIYADPPSHDFLICLLMAEMMRQHHRIEPPLKVRFLFIENQLGKFDFGPLSLRGGHGHPCPLSKQYSDIMINNVLRPAIKMLGAIEEPPLNWPINLDEISQYVEYDYHIGQLIDASREGYLPPRWTPPQWATDEVEQYIDGRRPIIITLREARSQPERNSQLEEWLKFAESVEDQYPVLFLRDTCKAPESLGHFPVYPRASRNPFIRVALYQRALVNMMVCNGPNTWVHYGPAPYLIFKELIPALPNWDHGNAKGWREQDHMEIGDQYAWATPRQCLTWTDDTFENISAAFENFLAQDA